MASKLLIGGLLIVVLAAVGTAGVAYYSDSHGLCIMPCSGNSCSAPGEDSVPCCPSVSDEVADTCPLAGKKVAAPAETPEAK